MTSKVPHCRLIGTLAAIMARLREVTRLAHA